MTAPIPRRSQPRMKRSRIVALAAALMFGVGTAWAQSDPGPPRSLDRADDGRSAESGLDEFAPPPHGRQMRGGERGGRGDPPPGLWARMSTEEKAELLSFVQEHFPKLYVELDRLEQMQPMRHAVRMGRIASEMRHLLEVMATNPQLGRLMIKERRLDMETRLLAARYRHAETDGERDKIREEMRTLCEEAFDARLERRELEIGDLEARIVDLRERQEQAANMRDELVEQEIKDRLTRPLGRGRPDDRPDDRRQQRRGPRNDDR